MSSNHTIERRHPGRITKGPRIPWDRFSEHPRVRTTFGDSTKTFSLETSSSGKRSVLEYSGAGLQLRGVWEEVDEFGSRLNLYLDGNHDEVRRVRWVSIPLEVGIGKFLSYINSRRISFLENVGHTNYAHRIGKTTSIVRSVLPFRSRMYALITNRDTDESFLVGQDAPFLGNLKIRWKKNHFVFTISFSDLVFPPETSIQIGSILIARSSTHELLHRYFRLLASHSNSFERSRAEQNRIPALWLKSGNTETSELEPIREATLSPMTRGRNAVVAGIEFSPFRYSRNSRMVTDHPEFFPHHDESRRHFGIGRISIDLLNEDARKYLKETISTTVKTESLSYITFRIFVDDFSLTLVREALNSLKKSLLDASREKRPLLSTKGSTMEAAVGISDAIRLGSSKSVMKTIRTTLSVSHRNNHLWRHEVEPLFLEWNATPSQSRLRIAALHAAVVTGSRMVFDYVPDLLSAADLETLHNLEGVATDCAKGLSVPWDIMHRNPPSILYNTAGYLGVFNLTKQNSRSIVVPISCMFEVLPLISKIDGGSWKQPTKLIGVSSVETIRLDHAHVTIGPLRSYESRIFRLVGEE